MSYRRNQILLRDLVGRQLSVITIGLLLCLLPVLSAWADNSPGERLTVAQAPSLAQLQEAKKNAESDKLLDDAERKKVEELYDQAIQWLQDADDSKAQLERLSGLIRGAPERIDAIRSGELPAAKGMDNLQAILQDQAPARLELALTQEEVALQQARDSLRRHEDELARLLDGSKQLNEEIATKVQTLEEIDTDLKLKNGSEPPALSSARASVLQTRRLLRQNELERLTLRLGSHDLLTNLAQAERDAAATEIAERQRRLLVLNESYRNWRETQARQAREAAENRQAETRSLPEALQRIAGENAAHHAELETLVGREQTVMEDLQQARRGLQDFKTDFERTRQRVEVVGATEAVGRMLQRRRQELPTLLRYRRNSALRSQEIGRATDRQIEIDELLRAAGMPQAEIKTALDGLKPEQQAEFQEQADELVSARRHVLNELQKVYSRHVGRITALDLAERQLVEVANSYVDYIDDQLIWIPGRDLSFLLSTRSLTASLEWLTQPAHWQAMLGDLTDLALQKPGQIAIVALVFYLLLTKRGWARARLQAIVPLTRKIRSDSFWLTLQALALNLSIVGAWPWLMVGIGWSLSKLPAADGFSLSVAAGLLQAGVVMLSVRFLIEICLPDGLGERHLRWQRSVLDPLGKTLAWLLRPAVPLAFFVAAGSGHEAEAGIRTLGQLAFISLMLVSAVAIFRLLRRGNPLMTSVGDGGGPLMQMHFLWFPLSVLMAAGFALTSALGYHQAALYLQWHAELTFWLFLGLFLLKELLLRSLYIAERKLRFEDAVRRRDELRAQRAQAETTTDEAPPISLDIPEVNFVELSEQNKRLISTGFLFSAVIGVWPIWSELLPALGFFSNIELPLHAARVVDGVSREVPITLGDLIIGFIMVMITILAAKNIPGVLEIALLQRLPLDPGARYAITALSQYLIAGIGVVLAFSTLGLQWSNIQWLVAALSVGLGFGLQEIVANFISGIILLFERPIRVGDVVTLDNTTGVVSRIRIRATTIINYDKQELLIPNKEFITGRVINWTLTDKLNRVVIPVGVAYGSDVDRCMALMLEAAEENPEVLDDPKPVVSFESFGDNALTLSLRSYLGSMDNRLATITALHKGINTKFNDAGINIAFPQRDIHLSTEKPLDVRLHNEARDIEPAANK